MKKYFLLIFFSLILGCSSLLEYPKGTECANIYLIDYQKINESLSEVTSSITLTIQNQSKQKIKIEKLDFYILYDERTISHKILENIELSLKGSEKKELKIQFSFTETSFLNGLSNNRTLGRLKVLGIAYYSNNPKCFFESYISRNRKR